MTDANMEKLEIVIGVLILCLVALAVYAATSWTLSRKRRREVEADHEKEGVSYRYLEEEAEQVRKKVATAYAHETMPKITVTPVQPRPVFPRSLMSSDEVLTTDEEDESQSDDHPDLGRLYFALRYDQHRSMLIVRLIRAEDIPVEGESMSTYVDVHLLPLNLQGQTFAPYDTTINVSFREIYEFPLSQSDMQLQTLNLHICRYDSYSRKTSVGDVFLALAELNAQGIDFTREVFLCRNIISHQEIYRTLGKRKRMRAVDEGNKEEKEEKHRVRKTGKKVSSQKMWDVLRKAVRSGSYKGAYLPSDCTMYWESIFSPEVSSAEGYGFSSATGSPVKSSEFSFSGPGPTDAARGETEEDQGASWKERKESEFDFPPVHTDESEIESSANEQESNERRSEHSYSSPVEAVQLSPAPEEYYRIVPITPFTSCKGKKEATEPSVSWKLPQTFTSYNRDVVETLSQAYKEPRAVSFGSRPRYERIGGEGAPPVKQRLFGPSAPARSRETRQRRSPTMKTSRQKKPERRRRIIGSIKHSKRMSPRKEPDGEPAERVVGTTRAKAKHSTARFRGKSSFKGHKPTYRRKDSGPVEGESIEPLAFEIPTEESTLNVSPLPGGVHSTLNFPSFSTTVEYLTPPMSTLKDFYSINRSQSDPSVDVEHFRHLSESSSESRRTRSMLELREEEWAWDDSP